MRMSVGRVRAHVGRARGVKDAVAWLITYHFLHARDTRHSTAPQAAKKAFFGELRTRGSLGWA